MNLPPKRPSDLPEFSRYYQESASSYPLAPDRPLGVTLYAIFIIVAYGLLICSAGIPSLFTLLMMGISLVAVAGIWQMKEWGRILIIIRQGGGLILDFCTLSAIPYLPTQFWLTYIIGVTINIAAIYWFATNGHRFTK